jgi:uncharacterized protein
MAFTVKYDWWGVPFGNSSPELHQRPILGVNEDGEEVSIDLDQLFSGRLLIQGSSGSGKTSLIRKLISICSPYVQWIFIDPEGVAGSFQRNNPDTADGDAKWMRYRNISTIVDISDMTRERQLIYVTRFINSLIDTPEELWINKCLVIIDECEILCPTDTSAFNDPGVGKRSRAALVDLMSRGRKRGICGIVTTHRLAQLAPSIRSEARNFLIGGCSFDVDIHRAAELLGWARNKAFAILPKLSPGQFIAYGSCFGPKQLQIVQVSSP